MKNCECCNNEHDGSYGYGRFCSMKCARCFSTKKNRSLINEKISILRKLQKHPDVIKICKQCHKEFVVYWYRRTHTFCSNSCASSNRNIGKKCSDYQKNKISNSVLQNYKDGKKVYGGFTKWYTYKDLKVQGIFELRTCKILDT